MARSEYLSYGTYECTRSIDRCEIQPPLGHKKDSTCNTARPCPFDASRVRASQFSSHAHARISRHNTDDGRRTESSRRRKQQRQSEKKALNPIAIAASIGQENSCARFPPHSLSRVENQPQRSSLAARRNARRVVVVAAQVCGFTLQYPRSPPSNHSVYRLQNPFFRPETERSFPSRRAVEGFGYRRSLGENRKVSPVPECQLYQAGGLTHDRGNPPWKGIRVTYADGRKSLRTATAPFYMQ